MWTAGALGVILNIIWRMEWRIYHLQLDRKGESGWRMWGVSLLDGFHKAAYLPCGLTMEEERGVWRSGWMLKGVFESDIEDFVRLILYCLVRRCWGGSSVFSYVLLLITSSFLRFIIFPWIPSSSPHRRTHCYVLHPRFLSPPLWLNLTVHIYLRSLYLLLLPRLELAHW